MIFSFTSCACENKTKSKKSISRENGENIEYLTIQNQNRSEDGVRVSMVHHDS